MILINHNDVYLQAPKFGLPWVELVGRYSKLADPSYFCHLAPGARVPVAGPRVHNAQKRLGPEAVTQLIADYVAGAPSTALMTKYQLGKGTVLKILESHGISRRNQPLSDEQVIEAIQLYLSGWSMARVGRHFGRQHTVIRDVLKRHGITRRDSHGRAR